MDARRKGIKMRGVGECVVLQSSVSASSVSVYFYFYFYFSIFVCFSIFELFLSVGEKVVPSYFINAMTMMRRAKRFLGRAELRALETTRDKETRFRC